MVIQVLKGKHDLKCSTFLLPLLWLLESYCEEFIFQAKTSVGPATVASGKWQLNKDGLNVLAVANVYFWQAIPRLQVGQWVNIAVHLRYEVQ